MFPVVRLPPPLSRLCTMKTRSLASPLMLLKLTVISLLPVLEAQQFSVRPEVTGYLGHDVTLPCQFTQGESNTSITQVQWSLLPPDGKEITIIVSSSQFGVNIHESPLKDRVEIEEQSLVIKDVEMRDVGSYKCIIAAFPSGSFEGTTKLIVREQMPLSPGMVSAIVIAVILLVVIMAVTAYFYIRRHNSSVRHRVFIGTGGTEMDVIRPSVIVRDEDVVYSDVNFKSSGDVTPASSHKRAKAPCADVTYAEVVILGQQPS